MRYMVNVQPVIPFSLTQDWNLITRTILPIIHAEAPVEGGEAHSGSGDILQSFFLSPKAPVGGWIVGGGPALLYPSASDDALGSEKWGLGPTAVLLRQRSGFTYGILASGPTGGQHARRGQLHLPAAVLLLHHEDVHDVRHQHRVDLRLAARRVDGTAQSERLAAAQDRAPADQHHARWALLRRAPGRRPGLGPPLRGHGALSEVSGPPSAA
jgi:hypothetical protein